MNIYSTASNDDGTKPVKISGAAAITLSIIALVWMVAGIAALIRSLICMQDSRTGTMGTKVMMLVVAFLFGPLYWIVQMFVPYCQIKKR